MHDDEKFDEFLKQAAKDYKSPSVPPSEVIWAAIEQDVAQAIAPRNRFSRTFRTATWATIGVAATLLIGVAVGRWTSPASAPTQTASTTRPAAPIADSAGEATHARAVTYEHLAEAEVFLTSVRAELKTGRPDAERAERSRDLLVRTRVLLGGSENQSPEVARLLQDLELLLAEIAALPKAKSSLDETLLKESMRDGNILPRIRATLPARMAGA